MSRDPRRALRWILSAVVAFDLLGFAAFLPAAADRAAIAGAEVPAWAAAIAGPLRFAAIVVGLAGISAFAVRRAPLVGGALALVALGVLSHAHAQLDGSPWRHLYYSGLCLLGWLAGLGLARARRLADGEAHAIAGATALLGAAYFNAGLSKLVFGGPAWLAGETLRHAVVAQDGLVGDGLLHALRVAVAAHPAIAAGLASATVVFELGGVALLAGPRARLVVAAGLVAMHLTIFALTGIAYAESIVLLLTFAGLPRAAADESQEAREVPGARATAIAGVVLGLAAAVAIARQGLAADVEEAVTAAPTRSLGPFRRGDAIAGFRVVELAAAGDAATVFLERDGARLGFDLTCRDTPDVGPLDRPPLHVFYRATAVPFARLAPAGAAVRDLALEAGAPDVCAALRGWIAGAR